MVQYETKVDPNSIKKFDSGAQRSSGEGKGRFDLIPPIALRRLATKYQQGAEAYGERNWEKGMPFSRLVDSAKRHMNQYLEGDRSEDHLAAAAWNMFALMHFEVINPGLNDLPNFDVIPLKSIGLKKVHEQRMDRERLIENHNVVRRAN